MSANLSSVMILGSRVHVVRASDVLACLETWIAARGACRQVVVTGFHGLWEAHKDRALKAILNSAALWVPDGIAPVWIARLRGIRGAERVPGTDLLKGFLELSNTKRYCSFFYGDTAGTLEALRAVAESRYPGHRVAGMLAPPFRELTAAEDEEHIRTINAARPDVLWVGLGTPKQDRWIHAHLHRLDVPVAIGVGAAFGFVSGRVKHAPAWVGRLGGEWAYRLICEPRKCWRRSLVEGPQFLAHVLLELTGLRKYDGGP